MADERPAHGTFCWNELMTRDTGAAESFYSQLIGWTTAESGMPGMKYTLWKNGDNEAGGMMQMPPGVPENVPPHWMAYIAVDRRIGVPDTVTINARGRLVRAG